MRTPQGWVAGAPRTQPGPQYAWQIAVARQGPAKKPWRAVVKSILATLMLTYVAYLMVTLAVLVYGVGIVLPELNDATYTIYVLIPLLTPLFSISGTALEVYYLTLVVAIIVSVIWLIFSSMKGFTDELGTKAKSREHSALFDVCALFFGVLFFDLALAFIMVWGGFEPTDPVSDSDTWQMLFGLANASVWEEIVSRVALIGVPLLVIDLLRKQRPAKPYKYLLGGGFKIGLVEMALILVTATLFGLAHYDSWGAWKIFPAAVGGAAFGYLFLRHGLASAIVLHFAFDYLSMPTTVFTDSTGLTVAYVVGILLWSALGLIFFAYYIVRMAEFVTGQKYFEEKPRLVGAPTPFPQAYPPPGAYAPTAPPLPTTPYGYQVGPPPQIPRSPFTDGYVCPTCGHTQARWVDGKFRCMRCGNSS